MTRSLLPLALPFQTAGIDLLVEMRVWLSATANGEFDAVNSERRDH